MQQISANGPLKILLIDDSKGDAIIISKVLQQALPQAHILKKIPTVREALRIVSEEEFDVALLDRSLPDTRGFSGLHSIQNMSPKLPVIFLTGFKDEYLAFEAIKQGAQDYLFKDQLNPELIKRAIHYAILRKQFEETLIMRANFDMLTGLANRMLFENRLEVALSKIQQLGGLISVLLLDLDKFKQINDTMGHTCGDKLLKEVSHRLKESLRSYDIAARFGGDEFAILLEDLTKSQQSILVAQKIVNSLELPFNLAGKEIFISVSIGIVNYQAHYNMNCESLLQQADMALYEAKSTPGNSYYVRDINQTEDSPFLKIR